MSENVPTVTVFDEVNRRRIMLDVALFVFGLMTGIVLTIAAEVVFIFLFLDWILALVKGKGK